LGAHLATWPESLASAHVGCWVLGGGCWLSLPPRRSPRLAGGCLPLAGCDDRTMTLLTEDEIATALTGLPGWERAGSAIKNMRTLGDFRDAMLYAGAVAHLAQAANHHPDITIQWNKVTLTLSTHSAGGLTTNDFALAGQISALP